MTPFAELLDHRAPGFSAAHMTVGTVLLGLATLAGATLLAALVDRAVRRLLASRGHARGTQAAVGKVAR